MFFFLSILLCSAGRAKFDHLRQQKLAPIERNELHKYWQQQQQPYLDGLFGLARSFIGASEQVYTSLSFFLSLYLSIYLSRSPSLPRQSPLPFRLTLELTLRRLSRPKCRLVTPALAVCLRLSF